jgi:DNA replication protein DnaC
MSAKTTTDQGAAEVVKQIDFYSRALMAPRIREAATRLADQARAASWTHEEYLAAVLSREVAAREASGAELRIRAAGFTARKSMEDFNFEHQPAIKREAIAHLATAAFIAAADNLVLLGPPGTGKTHLASRWASKPPTPGTGSSSRPQPTGSPACKAPTTPDAWPRNSPGSDATA